MTKKLDFDFLAVNKDFLKLGLNPTEILLLSQIDEFNRNTGDCYMSDEVFAAQFGVSKSTISREMKVLESKGFIVRETKNVKGGKERHIHINLNNIKSALTNINLTLDGSQQTSNCLLSNVKLPIVNKQNDSIKENIKEKRKDNKGESLTAKAVKSSEIIPAAKGTQNNPIAKEKEWFIEKYNELQPCANGVYLYQGTFYKIGGNENVI